jgi:hypothetical protein
MNKIIAIFIFFDELDAALHDFYTFSMYQPSIGELKELDLPRMVLRDVDGKEIWLNGCNCGYNGEGPHGTESVLECLGLTPEQIAPVFRHEVVQYYLDQSEQWDIIARPSHFDPKRRKVSSLTDGKASLYMFRDQLVLLQTGARYVTRENPAEVTLFRHQAFIPNPVEVTIFQTNEEAIDAGYFNAGRQWEYRGTRPYRLIIRDQSGRQLWLDPLMSNKEPIGKQELLVNLLNYCGFEAPQDSFDSRLGQWINSLLKLSPPKRIVLTRRGYTEKAKKE